MYMKIHHETLVLLTRTTPAERVQGLIGEKLRGPQKRMRVLPGGKLEGNEDRAAGAARELHEETGIMVPPERLTLAADLLVDDNRHQRRVAYIGLFIANVGLDVEPHVTDELRSQWEDVNNPGITHGMHPDVQAWWPYVLDSARLPLKIHIIHEPDTPPHALPEVIVKEPGQGQVFVEQPAIY
jgi:ADP-ribose pyrophosphatase YjhB (NUDIX family)